MGKKGYANLPKMAKNGIKWPEIGKNKELFVTFFAHGELCADSSMLINSTWRFQDGQNLMVCI